MNKKKESEKGGITKRKRIRRMSRERRIVRGVQIGRKRKKKRKGEDRRSKTKEKRG